MNLTLNLDGISALLAIPTTGGPFSGVPIWIASMVLFCLVFLVFGVRSVIREVRAMEREENAGVQPDPSIFSVIGSGTNMVDRGNRVNQTEDVERSVG